MRTVFLVTTDDVFSSKLSFAALSVSTILLVTWGVYMFPNGFKLGHQLGQQITQFTVLRIISGYK